MVPVTFFRDELRALGRLAAPVVAVQVGMMLMGTVDIMMLGRVSDQAIAAGALGNSITWGVMWFAVGILMSIDPLVSQSFGAGEHDAIKSHFSRAVVLAVLLSLPIAVILWWIGRLLPLAGHDRELAATTVVYLRGTVWGIPGFFLFVVQRQTLQAMSLIRPALFAIVVANVFNLIANYALVFGHFGLPAFGVRGSAWATSGSRWVMCLALLLAAAPVLRRYWDGWTTRLLRLRLYAQAFRIGLPIAVQVSLEIWVFSTVAVLMGSFGTAEVAGHQVALNLAAMTFMIPLGIAGAAATRVGNAIGRRDPEGARRSAVVSLVLGGSVMSLSALVLFSVPELLSRLYTSEVAVIAVANLLIPIAALFQVGDGLQVVAAGILRGAADTRFAAVNAFVGFWLVALPTGVFLAYGRGLGPVGLWLGLTVGLTVVALVLVLRVRHRLWSGGTVLSLDDPPSAGNGL